MTVQEALVQAVDRQLLRGLRESLTIAGQIGPPVETVNAVLSHLQAACDGCLLLTQPYAGEPRVVVTVVTWDTLKRAAGAMEEGSPQCLGSQRSPMSNRGLTDR